MQNPTRQHLGDTRSRLLEAAAVRVYERGFFRTTLDEIAADVEIAKATFYHHFKNKDELGAALIELNIGKYLQHFKTAIFHPRFSGLQQIKNLLKMVENNFENGDFSRGCPIGNLVYELADYSDSFRQKLENYFEELFVLVEAALKDAKEKGEIKTDCNVADMAHLLVMELQGCCVIARTGIKGNNLQDGLYLIKRCQKIFLELVGATGAA